MNAVCSSFKHAVKSAWGGCVDYCRRFLSARITLTDSAPSYIWQQVSQRFLSICVTIFWLPVLIHSVLVKLVSHCFCVHVCTSLWLFCDVYWWLVVFYSIPILQGLYRSNFWFWFLLNMQVLKFGWHESTNLLLSFLILICTSFLLSGTLWAWGWDKIPIEMLNHSLEKSSSEIRGHM